MIDRAQLMQLFNIAIEYQWMAEAVLLVLLFFLPTKNKLTNSNTISLAVFAFVGGISYRYGLLIMQDDPNVALTPLQFWLSTHRQWMLFAWYIGLWLFAFVGMLATYLLHRRFSLPNGYATKTMLLAYLCVALLNAFSFVERSLWDTSYVFMVYQWGIPGINIGVLMVFIGVTIKAAYDYMLKNKISRVRS